MDAGGSVRLTVTGPLAPYEAALRVELTRVGYAPVSVIGVVRAMARLSDWMRHRGIAPGGLTPRAVEEFLAVRREVTFAEGVARRGLGALLRFLRGCGVIPRDVVDGGTPVEVLLAGYRDYLLGERGLAAESVRCYLVQGRKFLADLARPLDRSLQRLDAAAVISFIVGQARRSASVWSAKTLVTATRSLLRFLHVEGLISAPLVGAVPAVAGWRLSALPRGLARGQVQAVLAGPDTCTPAGLRDHAVLTVLARLGLRGAEAAALGLDDVDWRAGEIIVRGKGSRIERIPLPVEVGQALAAYVTGGRPVCACPALFVTARAPYQAMSGSTVRAIMSRACQKAGLPRLGAHRLRHSLATDLLRAGAPLTEVGQLLRHRSQLSTTVYAKVDYTALRTLARPWPLTAPSGGAS
jgi:integrase/recombinase XerD